MNRLSQAYPSVGLIISILLISTLLSEYYRYKYKIHDSASYIKPEQLSEEERLDFSSIEPVLEDIASQDISGITLNADLPPYLNRLTRPFLDQELTEAQINRLQFLLQQSLPADTQQHLGRLFIPYLHYQRIKRDQLKTDTQTPLSPAEALRKHQLLIPIRESIFGADTSRVLFSKHDQFTEFLLKRQILKNQSHPSSQARLIDG